MKAFVKTLFGDVRNVAVVALLVAVAFGLIAVGHAEVAVYVVPVLAMASIVWLALH